MDGLSVWECVCSLSLVCVAVLSVGFYVDCVCGSVCWWTGKDGKEYIFGLSLFYYVQLISLSFFYFVSTFYCFYVQHFKIHQNLYKHSHSVLAIVVVAAVFLYYFSTFCRFFKCALARKIGAERKRILLRSTNEKVVKRKLASWCRTNRSDFWTLS